MDFTETRCPTCAHLQDRAEPCAHCLRLRPLQPGETAVKRAEHIHDAGGIFDAPNRLRPDYAEPWTSEHQKRYDRTLRVRDPQEKG